MIVYVVIIDGEPVYCSSDLACAYDYKRHNGGNVYRSYVGEKV